MKKFWSHHLWLGNNYKEWAAYLLTTVLCISNLSKYLAFSQYCNSVPQIGECYIMIGSTLTWFSGMFLCCILLLSDAPFIRPTFNYEIIRIGKKLWMQRQIVHIIYKIISYQITLFFITIIITRFFGQISIDNTWSYALQKLVHEQPIEAIKLFHISFPFQGIVEKLTPYGALIYSFTTNFLYIFCIGLILFNINIISPRNIGWGVAVGIHIAGYLIQYAARYQFLYKFSLLMYAIPAFHFVEWYALPPLFVVTTMIAIVAFLIYIANNNSMIVGDINISI